jgi:hypothetical protein
MNRDDFDRAVTATLEAVKAAALAEHLAHELADALTRTGLPVPPDLERIFRASLCRELEPSRDPRSDRAQVAALVDRLPAP